MCIRDRCYCSAIKNAPGDLLISCILAFTQIGLSVLLILFSVCDNSYLDRVWGYSVPTVAVGVGVCVFFFFKGKRFVAPKQWKFCLSFSIPMIFNGIAYLVILSLIHILAGLEVVVLVQGGFRHG